MIRQRESTIQSRTERQIITGMIVSTKFLKDIIPLLDNGGIFQAGFANTVSRWCIEYFEKYGTAPRQAIEDLFLANKRTMPEDQFQTIQDFLVGLSDDFARQEEAINTDHYLDEAEKYFSEVSVKEFNAVISKCLMTGDIAGAENAIATFRRPSRPRIVGVDPFRDRDFISSITIDEEENPDIVLRLPGALGKATGPLERGFLVALQAESGVGKTWWLWFLARLAVMSGFNVPFFSLEMSLKKMGLRIWQDLLGATIDEEPVQYPEFDCVMNQENTCDFPYRMGSGSITRDALAEHRNKWIPCRECEHRGKWDRDKVTTIMREKPANLFQAADALYRQERYEKSSVLKKWGKMNLAAFAENSFTTKDMFVHLDNLEYIDGMVPDMVVSDYADKHKWEIPRDPRNSIGLIWADYKRLAQERHCLALTASQSNTERDNKTVGKGSWSENIEKRRKIDLGLALNQKDKDLEKGLLWVTVDKKRHGKKVVSSLVAVTQCLDIGRPYLDSCLVKRYFG